MKIICINDESYDYLTLGKIYTVIKYAEWKDPQDKLFKIYCDDDLEDVFEKERFKIILE